MAATTVAIPTPKALELGAAKLNPMQINRNHFTVVTYGDVAKYHSLGLAEAMKLAWRSPCSTYRELSIDTTTYFHILPRDIQNLIYLLCIELLHNPLNIPINRKGYLIMSCMGQLHGMYIKDTKGFEGSRQKVGTLLNNIITGPYVKYDKSTHETESGDRVNNLRQGTVISNTFAYQYIMTFDNGALNGPYTCIDIRDDKVNYTQNYNDGLKNGNMFTYGKNGSVCEIAMYQNDWRHGKTITFFSTGQIKSIQHFVKSNIMWSQVWYEDTEEIHGQMASWVHYDVVGAWHGLCQIWSEQGKLTLDAVFEHGTQTVSKAVKE